MLVLGPTSSVALRRIHFKARAQARPRASIHHVVQQLGRVRPAHNAPTQNTAFAKSAARMTLSRTPQFTKILYRTVGGRLTNSGVGVHQRGTRPASQLRAQSFAIPDAITETAGKIRNTIQNSRKRTIRALIARPQWSAAASARDHAAARDACYSNSWLDAAVPTRAAGGLPATPDSAESRPAATQKPSSHDRPKTQRNSKEHGVRRRARQERGAERREKRHTLT